MQSETNMDPRPSSDLLESAHAFPGVYQIKAIGPAGGDFVDRVLAAAAAELATPGEIDHTVRTTPNGRHTSLTLDVTVQSADQVRAIYDRIRQIEGLTLLL
jgi:uncharacterized protein